MDSISRVLVWLNGCRHAQMGTACTALVCNAMTGRRALDHQWST